MKKCILIISHGSRERSANQDFKLLVHQYQKRHPTWKVSHAFLELAHPSIPEALESLSLRSKNISVLPLFLFAAKHVKKHIPDILDQFQSDHPAVEVKLAKPLGSHPKLWLILDQRVEEIRG